MICFGPSAGEKCGHPATVAQLVEQRFRKPQGRGFESLPWLQFSITWEVSSPARCESASSSLVLDPRPSLSQSEPPLL